MPAIDPNPETLELCLLAMAVSGGNAAEAQKHLALLEPPVKVSASTLHKWKTKYANRYSEIQADRAPLIESIVLEKIREAIMQAGSLQTRTLEMLLAKLEAGEIEAKDLATILKAAGVSLGINVEKMLLLTNRPTAITEKRELGELLQSLSSRIPGLIQATDGSAVQIGPGTPNGAHEGAPHDG